MFDEPDWDAGTEVAYEDHLLAAAARDADDEREIERDEDEEVDE